MIKSRNDNFCKVMRKGGASHDYVTGSGCSDDSEYVR